MNHSDITLLINFSASDDLPARIAAVAPGARIITRQQFQADESLIEQADVVLGHLEGRLFARAPRLKWLQGTSAGADWLGRNNVPPHPAVLTKACIHAESISQHLFAMLLMLVRGIDVAHANQPAGLWQYPGGESVETLGGKTLCVVGLGTIGSRCAELGEAFGMSVIGVQRCPHPAPHTQRVYGSEQLLEALGRADVVMLLLPLTPRTDRMIGCEAFAAMKDGAYLLNAGRGRTVDTEAMMDALRRGKLKAAGLDVTDPEPLPREHPLWRMPRVVITPHYSGSFPGYDRRIEDLFMDNLARFLAGQPLRYVVDRAEGY